ncbi:MAG: sigma 54-interacting transcriptional regulator [Myxococcota bacterium]|nr:sigma 54-interacting transcriptional regulator [Myxococcota bacterium]
MAEERTRAALLARIVRELCNQPDVALARIWTLAPGDQCGTCPMRAECPRHVPCLHLAASAGRPLDPDADWSRLDGAFRRVPVGVRKIGRVARGESLCVEEIASDAQWIARPDWARAERIQGFGGAPLAVQGEVLGVLGVFTRSRFCPDTVAWLRIIADHAASALATSRAFEEIERLRDRLALENEYLREEVDEAKAPAGIVGSSAPLRAVLERVELVAPTDATVLIQGESGTGKELVAREIHRKSARAERPLIQVNCAAVPRELYESEFFGHVRGAFTGATRDRAGRFAAAHGGTLFLDEIGEIPLELQGKLLRVLQEGTYERVGEERTRTVDVRVIAATNRDLRAEVAAGRFREDLYYRLDVFPIAVAPLRERREDIVPIAEHFLARGAAGTGRPAPRLAAADRARLEAHPWPGNVRELQNAVERALITWRGGPLRIDPEAAGRRGAAPAQADAEPAALLTERELRELERQNLRRAMLQARWKVSGPGGAAELLGVKPTTLASRLRKLGIERQA